MLYSNNQNEICFSFIYYICYVCMFVYNVFLLCNNKYWLEFRVSVHEIFDFMSYLVVDVEHKSQKC